MQNNNHLVCFPYFIHLPAFKLSLTENLIILCQRINFVRNLLSCSSRNKSLFCSRWFRQSSESNKSVRKALYPLSCKVLQSVAKCCKVTRSVIECCRCCKNYASQLIATNRNCCAEMLRHPTTLFDTLRLHGNQT